MKIIPWMKNTLPLHAPILAGIHSLWKGNGRSTRLLTLSHFLRNCKHVTPLFQMFLLHQGTRKQAAELSKTSHLEWTLLERGEFCTLRYLPPNAGDCHQLLTLLLQLISFGLSTSRGKSPQQEGKSEKWVAKWWLRERKEPLRKETCDRTSSIMFRAWMAAWLA